MRKNSRKLRASTVLPALLSLLGTALLFAGCEASFKNSDEKIEAMRAPAASNAPAWVAQRAYTSAFDANISGGGTIGTSAGFRVLGANLSSTQKVNGSSATFKVRGGIMGQYNQ